MLRQLFVFPALAAIGAALCVPAMASEMTGSFAVTGSLHYTDDNGTKSFFTDAQASPGAFTAFSSQSSSVNSLTLTNDFLYNGNISPAVFAANFGGTTGTLTLTSLLSVVNAADGMEVVLSGTFDQAGYAQELASVSFLLNSNYMGNNVNQMTFNGIAQLTPAIPVATVAAPEPRSIALLGTGILGLAGLLRRKLRRDDELSVRAQ